VEKSGPLICATFVIFKKAAQSKQPPDEAKVRPNLVTLFGCP
jgi:hypothetical protein